MDIKKPISRCFYFASNGICTLGRSPVEPKRSRIDGHPKMDCEKNRDNGGYGHFAYKMDGK